MNNIVTIENPKSPIAESYRNIRTNIEFSNIDKDLKTVKGSHFGCCNS